MVGRGRGRGSQPFFRDDGLSGAATSRFSSSSSTGGGESMGRGRGRGRQPTGFNDDDHTRTGLQPSIGRGRGRGVSNQPAWMTQSTTNQTQSQRQQERNVSKHGSSYYNSSRTGSSSISKRKEEFDHDSRERKRPLVDIPSSSSRPRYSDDNNDEYYHDEHGRERKRQNMDDNIVIESGGGSFSSQQQTTINDLANEKEQQTTQQQQLHKTNHIDKTMETIAADEDEDEDDISAGALEEVANAWGDDTSAEEDEEAKRERRRRERQRKLQNMLKKQEKHQQQNESLATKDQTKVNQDEARSKVISTTTISVDKKDIKSKHNSNNDIPPSTTTNNNSNEINSEEGKDNDDDDDDDSLDDMFAVDDTVTTTCDDTNRGKKTNSMNKGKKLSSKLNSGGTAAAATDNANHDDSEGYYRATIGEYIGPLKQYKVLGTIGKGVFSTVIKCIDISSSSENEEDNVVALKLIRNNETMSKAAQKELRILNILSSSSSSSNKMSSFCIELLEGSGFEHCNHVVFVFEYFERNLREVLHKFGKHVGIAIGAVHTYAKQLLLALYHLQSHGVVHADIKPDNILVNANYSMVKLCDFGSAYFVTDPDNEIPTPYMVSRFYRSPEVILGLTGNNAGGGGGIATGGTSTANYGSGTYSIDLWSIAVTLAELYLGRVLFAGTSNNDMLHRFMETLGPFSHKMLRRHFVSFEKLMLQPHFNPTDYYFRQQQFDKVTNQPVLKLVQVTSAKPSCQLQQQLLSAKSENDNLGQIYHFSDFLQKCLVLDPHKRITVVEALKHPFIVPSKSTKTTTTTST